MSAIFPPPAPSQPCLLCVDVQREYAAAGRPLHSLANEATLAACREVMAHARGRGWTVMHSILQREAGLFGRGTEHARPVDQLEPLATEQVYIRDGLSVLSHPTLARLAGRARWEVYVIGFSLSHSLLSTAFDAASCGLRLTFVEDAVGATPVNGMTADKVKEVAQRLLAPFANFTTLEALQGSSPPRLVAAAWPLIQASGGMG